MKTFYSLWLLSVVVFIGCQSESSTEPPRNSDPKLFFTPANITMSTGQQTELSFVIENLLDSVFAVSMQIGFVDSVLSFTGMTDAESGGFFGSEAVQFAHDSLSVLHVTISRIQGQTAVMGSGTICILQFRSVAAGNCELEVLPDQLAFYDVAGRELETPDIEITNAVVHVN